MKNLLFLLLFFPVFAYSQGVASTKEMEDNTIYIAPQTAYIKGTNRLNGAVQLKRIRIDSLLAMSAKGVSALVVNKADLSYVNAQLANLGISQANAKMDSVRVKALLMLKANLADLNSKADISLLSTKANSSDLSLKENTVDVNAKLGFKAPVLNPIFQGDVEINSIGNGVIIKSQNGTRFRLTISNTGDIIATSLQ